MIHNDRIVVDGIGRLPQFAHAGISDDWVFVSGTLGTTTGLELAPGGVGPETAQTLRNIENILRASAATWSDVVKVNVYVADMADFPAMNEAYGAFFADTVPPARMTAGGVSLALGARVEIECVAHRRPAGPEARTAPVGATHVGREEPSPATAPVRTTGLVEHDGESLYYEVVGSGGTPLVLSHGAGGNHAAWFQNVAALAADRMVVTWDHRGYGRSTDRADRSGPEVATGDLLAVLDHLGIDRADLVGQSMGGWTVVGAALARPGVARSVVLSDTLGGVGAPTIAAARQAAAHHAASRPAASRPAAGTGSIPEATPPTAASGPADGDRSLRSTSAPDFGGDDRLGFHPALGTGFSRREPALAHLYTSLGRMGSADPATILPRLISFVRTPEDAARLTMPVLCIVGDEDPLFPPATVRALADLLPDARVVEISGCGHSPYYEDPDTWNTVVHQFLVAIDRRI